MFVSRHVGQRAAAMGALLIQRYKLVLGRTGNENSEFMSGVDHLDGTPRSPKFRRLRKIDKENALSDLYGAGWSFGQVTAIMRSSREACTRRGAEEGRASDELASIHKSAFQPFQT
jgi:hypothetical protein